MGHRRGDVVGGGPKQSTEWDIRLWIGNDNSKQQCLVVREGKSSPLVLRLSSFFWLMSLFLCAVCLCLLAHTQDDAYRDILLLLRPLCCLQGHTHTTTCVCLRTHTQQSVVQ